MESKKKRLLENTYHLFFDAGTKNVSARPLQEFVDRQVIGFGTAIDEKLRGIRDFRKLLQFQSRQMKGLVLHWKKIPFSRQITPDENTAVYADDLYLTIGNGKEKLTMYMRFSIVLHFNGGVWKVIHWHGSKPEEVKSKEDTYGVDQWKKKATELQQLVEQRTADLLLKNRELEIEASLEKVRTVAMGMKERSDMLKICTIIAKQLAVLGLSEIRNVQTAIFKVPAGTYMNYEYYAKHDKTFITETLYTNHKLAFAFAKKMLKGKGAVSITHIKGKEKVMDWLRYQKGTNVFIDNFLKKTTSLSYYWYSLGPVALGTSTYQPLSKDEQQLFERFLKVFELAYQRYLDIEKAESQVREAQIEAALERVRARSMAMNDSAEIGKLILHVYTELTKLDARLDRCFFMIVNPENRGITWWMASQEGLLSANGFFVQYNEHPSHQLYLNHWKKRTKKWQYLFAGKEKRDWDRFGFSRTELSRLPEPVKKFMAGAKSVHLSGSSDAFGSLVTGSFEPLSDEHQDIISRFASVFNQTYTRFNDLKKAEAQARESQIEAALERIRSRTVGMQQSGELKDVIQVVYEQFVRLGIHTEHAGFIMDYKEREDFPTWIADQFGSPSYAILPYFDCIYYNRFKEAKKRGSDFFSLTLDRQEKNSFYKDLFRRLPGFPEASKKIIFAHPGFSISTVLLDNVALYIENFTGLPFSEEANTILIRFGKVFQQTYTRFLDLQKAEAQAQEAEIELALERVRARALAMHSSDEFMEVAKVLREQMGLLGQKELETSAVHLYEEEADHIFSWRAFRLSSEVKGKITYGFFKIPRNSCAIAREFDQKFKSKASEYTIEVSGARQAEWYKILFKLAPEVKEAMTKSRTTREKRYYHFSRFSGGALLMVSSVAPAQEVKELQKRSAQVFDLAYRRFKDLRKAEAQTRESTIQLALERVRARTMAMQQSTELPEAANLLFQQLKGLGMPAWSAGYCIWEDDLEAVTLWMSSEGVIQPPFKAPTTEDELFIQMREGHEKGKALHVVEMGGQKLQAHYQYMRSLPVVGEVLDSNIEAGHPLPVFQVMHYAYFSKGYLLFITYEPVPQAHPIFIRFASVFDQTYTRFLDLKKAEEQAREAQIEVAVERVRAKALAMHRSEDLHSVVITLKKELQGLKIPNISAATIYLEQEDGLIRVLDLSDAGKEDDDRPQFQLDAVFRLEDTDPKLWVRRMWAQQEKYFVHEADQEDFLRVIEFLHWIDPAAGQQAEDIIRGDSIWKAWLPTVKLNHGIMNIDLLAPPAAEIENIMIKIGAGFDLAYKRFQDLLKAEAQAREATIEAALERVRSRSMAMHRSEELSDLSLELVKQVQALGVATWFCAFNIYDNDHQGSLEWGSNGQGVFPQYHTPREGIFLRYYEAGQRGETLLINEIGEEECPAHYEYLCSLPGVGDQLLQMKAAGLPFPASQIDHVAFFKHGYIIFITYEPVPETHEIFKRFARVFEQSYTRFLDLHKAEAQARESQIEVAVERVRAKALAMHRSEEILQVAMTLKEQMERLELKGVTAATIYLQQEDGLIRAWDITELKESENGPQLTVDFAFKLEDTDPDLWVRRIWETKERYSVIEMSGNDFSICEKWLRSFDANAADNYLQFIKDADLNHSWHPTVPLEMGKLNIDFILPPPAEMEFILPKMGAAFDLAYRRFLDLQKAEEQARESQIQLALERVRARTMAMHKSDELPETSHILFEQMKELGEPVEQLTIGIINEENRVVEISATRLGDTFRKIYNHSIDEPYMMSKVYEAWKKQQKTLVVALRGDELNQYNQYRNELTNSKMFLTDYGKDDQRIVYAAFFSKGVLAFGANEIRPPASLQLLVKFASVFDLTYRRFLDLQKAEAQAREAQIETALERVRSRAMAMHFSDELKEVALELRKQMGLLGQNDLEVCAIHLYDLDENYFESWSAMKSSGSAGAFVQGFARFPKKGIRIIDELMAKQGAGLKDYILVNEGEKREEWFRVMNQYMPELYESILSLFGDISQNEMIAYWSVADFAGGALVMVTHAEPDEQTRNLLRRTANVFELAYTRFVDLKKAEAQTREAQIEAALEKVRSRTMAMQSSNELQETAAVLFEEFKKLGNEEIYQVTIGTYKEEEQLIDFRVTDWAGSGKQELRTFQLDMNEPTLLQPAVTAWREGKKSAVFDLTGDRLQGWLDYRNKISGITMRSQDTSGRRVISTAYFSKGHLSLSSPFPLAPDTIKTLERFAAVFDGTYTRFVDLEKAEEQAREAQIEAALEKVRSRTLAMQKSDELSDTAAELFRQMIGLGIEPNRLYIGIVNPETRDMEMWATDEQGTGVGKKFNFNAADNVSVGKLYDGWAAKERSVTVDMQGKELEEYIRYLQQLNIPLSHALTQKRRVQSVAFFDKGFIGMASPDEQSEKNIQLLERFAAVFNLTFTRFNDLKIAEAHAAQAELDLVAIKEAKQKAEEALTELQATQKQLIQSEKMASLGELTAGIAHEIQNPLNFVNNFSEVSRELLDEMKEEMEKGNLDDAKEIMQDVIQNLEKIHHHGKRADGIVKGMLQHSRTGSGQMEPTDINALCDEYLRLSYHGLRAKDKSFNARFETHFDQTIGKINVLPQDLGRVILNLINNAFYAVSERKKSGETGYEPCVEVSTTLSPLPGRGVGGEVKISVKDNGGGIPEKVLDKIFQPFFTTKPTGQGTGLGLSLSYDIVKAHGGEIIVETTEGEGTNFRILLPV